MAVVPASSRSARIERTGASLSVSGSDSSGLFSAVCSPIRGDKDFQELTGVLHRTVHFTVVFSGTSRLVVIGSGIPIHIFRILEGDIDVFDCGGDDVDGVLLAAIITIFIKSVSSTGLSLKENLFLRSTSASGTSSPPRRFFSYEEAPAFRDLAVLRDCSSDYRLSSHPDGEVFADSRDDGIGGILRILPQ